MVCPLTSVTFDAVRSVTPCQGFGLLLDEFPEFRRAPLRAVFPRASGAECNKSGVAIRERLIIGKREHPEGAPELKPGVERSGTPGA